MMRLEKNITLFFWIELLGNTSFLAPVLSLFYLHRGLHYYDLFGLMIVWVITVFFLEVPTGAFADRYGPKWSFLVGNILRTLSISLLFIAFHRWIFYLISAVSALSFTFFSGSDQAFIFETLKDLKRENEMSHVWGRMHSAKFIPAVITILVGAYIARDLAEIQFTILIFLGLLFNAGTLLLVCFLTPPSSFLRQNRHPTWIHVRKGWENIKGQTNLVLLFINETLVMIPTYVLLSNESLAQPYLTDSGLPVILLGVVYAVDALGSFLVLNAIKGLEAIFGQKKITVLTGLGILIAFIAGILLPQTIATALFVFFTIKLSFWIRYPVFGHIKNYYIPSSSRATTLSIFSMIDSLFDIVILSIMGFLSQLGIHKIFMFCAVIVLIGLCFPVRIRQKTI